MIQFRIVHRSLFGPRICVCEVSILGQQWNRSCRTHEKNRSVVECSRLEPKVNRQAHYTDRQQAQDKPVQVDAFTHRRRIYSPKCCAARDGPLLLLTCRFTRNSNEMTLSDPRYLLLYSSWAQWPNSAWSIMIFPTSLQSIAWEQNKFPKCRLRDRHCMPSTWGVKTPAHFLTTTHGSEHFHSFAPDFLRWIATNWETTSLLTERASVSKATTDIGSQTFHVFHSLWQRHKINKAMFSPRVFQEFDR